MRLLTAILPIALGLPALAIEPVNISRRGCDVLDPRWSADSREIFFYSTCNPAAQPGWQMEVMNADGSNARVLQGRSDFRPKPSPDGKRIAFDSYRDGNNHEVYVADRDGGNPVRLTDHPGYDVGPSWSPDSRWLVFSSGAQPLDMSRTHWYGESDLYIMRPDGSERRRLTATPGDDVYPLWSPDGKFIAFTSWRDGNPEIYLIAPDGTGERRLTNSISRENLAGVSADGRFISFTSDRTGNNDVFVMNVDGSGITNLTNHPSNDADGSWSADGKWFVFSSRREGNWNFYRVPASAAVPRPQAAAKPIRAGKMPVNVTRHAGADTFGNWSPDGRTIAFQSDRNPATPYRDSALYAIGLEGGGVVSLPHVWAESRPSWSPDGKRVIFESERDGDLDLYILELEGMAVRALVDDPGAQSAARWSADGSRVAYASTTPGEQSDVWVINADGSGKRNVTGHSATDGAPDWSPDGKRLVFASNRDGNLELYTIELESGAVNRLTTNEVADVSPDWSADGHRIAYTTVVNGASEVVYLDLRDRHITNVSNHAAYDHQPSWAPDSCRLLFTSKRGGDLDLWMVDTCAS
jgi:Tol biopolymer transport system component